MPTRSDVLDLPARLRRDTAALHRSAEQAVDLPASVRTRAGYAEVLRRFRDLHGPLEQQLAAPAWRAGWAALGVDLARHRRAAALDDDLARLGDASPAGSAPAGSVPAGARPAGSAPAGAGPAGGAGAELPVLAGFGQAVGCLYVLEGSSLGGRVLAPAVRAQVGDVPVRFLAGQDRDGPRAWRALRDGLRRLDPGAADDAVRGAEHVFAAFARHLDVHRRSVL